MRKTIIKNEGNDKSIYGKFTFAVAGAVLVGAIAFGAARD